MRKRDTPWLVEAAVDWIEDHLWALDGAAHVFEYGSGVSTDWLEARCLLLNSVEHDHMYGSIPKGNKPLLRERPYHNAIDEGQVTSYDMILVDGRDRVLCIEAAIPYLKGGGLLVLDNSERPRYAPGVKLMDTWNCIHFEQRRPDRWGYTYPGWRTSIFTKP